MRSRRVLPQLIPAVLALALCAAGWTSPAAAGTAITADPPVPAAGVPFRLLVTGTTLPTLEPRDAEPEVVIDGDDVVLRIGGRHQVIGTPLPAPFAFWVDFPHGLPSDHPWGKVYTVHLDVFYLETPGQPIRQASLPLLVGPGVEVTAPSRITEGETATVVLEGEASCPYVGETEVVGDEIRIYLNLACQILPPGSAPFRFEVELDSLPAGRYRVVVGAERSIYGLADLEVLPNPVRLQGGRFLVDVTYSAQGSSGQAHLVDMPSDESALFWFFGPGNWELMLKVLDGCAINGHYWVFGAATTDVAHDITVEDTVTGNLWTFGNPAGRIAEAITDTRALPCGDAGFGEQGR